VISRAWRTWRAEASARAQRCRPPCLNAARYAQRMMPRKKRSFALWKRGRASRSSAMYSLKCLTSSFATWKGSNARMRAQCRSRRALADLSARARLHACVRLWKAHCKSLRDIRATQVSVKLSAVPVQVKRSFATWRTLLVLPRLVRNASCVLRCAVRTWYLHASVRALRTRMRQRFTPQSAARSTSHDRGASSTTHFASAHNQRARQPERDQTNLAPEMPRASADVSRPFDPEPSDVVHQQNARRSEQVDLTNVSSGLQWADEQPASTGTRASSSAGAVRFLDSIFATQQASRMETVTDGSASLDVLTTVNERLPAPTALLAAQCTNDGAIACALQGGDASNVGNVPSCLDDVVIAQAIQADAESNAQVLPNVLPNNGCDAGTRDDAAIAHALRPSYAEAALPIGGAVDGGERCSPIDAVSDGGAKTYAVPLSLRLVSLTASQDNDALQDAATELHCIVSRVLGVRCTHQVGTLATFEFHAIAYARLMSLPLYDSDTQWDLIMIEKSLDPTLGDRALVILPCLSSPYAPDTSILRAYASEHALQIGSQHQLGLLLEDRHRDLLHLDLLVQMLRDLPMYDIAPDRDKPSALSTTSQARDSIQACIARGFRRINADATPSKPTQAALKSPTSETTMWSSGVVRFQRKALNEPLGCSLIPIKDSCSTPIGLRIKAITPGGLLATKGVLRKDDVITAINNVPVEHAGTVQREFKQSTGSVQVAYARNLNGLPARQ
jgi:hypothetical protein